MAKVGKKASTKAIEYAQKMIDENRLDESSIEYSGQTLGKSTAWETCFYIISSGFELDIHTGCERTGNNTVIKLYKTDTQECIEKFELPNELTWDEKACDWEWNFIYKYLCEWLMKNVKKLGKPKKNKDSKASIEDLMKQVADLREQIKAANAKEKKKLIDQYNKLSKVLSVKMDAKEAEVKAAINSAKASEEELEVLRKRKVYLTNKIRNDGAKGKPVDQYRTELAEIANELRTKKLGIKSK